MHDTDHCMPPLLILANLRDPQLTLGQRVISLSAPSLPTMNAIVTPILGTISLKLVSVISRLLCPESISSYSSAITLSYPGLGGCPLLDSKRDFMRFRKSYFSISGALIADLAASYVKVALARKSYNVSNCIFESDWRLKPSMSEIRRRLSYMEVTH